MPWSAPGRDRLLVLEDLELVEVVELVQVVELLELLIEQVEILVGRGRLLATTEVVSKPVDAAISASSWRASYFCQPCSHWAAGASAIRAPAMNTSSILSGGSVTPGRL